MTTLRREDMARLEEFINSQIFTHYFISNGFTYYSQNSHLLFSIWPLEYYDIEAVLKLLQYPHPDRFCFRCFLPGKYLTLMVVFKWISTLHVVQNSKHSYTFIGKLPHFGVLDCFVHVYSQETNHLFQNHSLFIELPIIILLFQA